MREISTAICSAVFAGFGAWLGLTIHGLGPSALLTTVAGALGGYGIPGAAWQAWAFEVARRDQGDVAGSVPPA